MAKTWKCQASRLFNDTIVITDPCYLSDDDIDDAVERNGLLSTTYYGDWGCTLFIAGETVGCVGHDAARLGHFTADTGRVCVVSLDTAKSIRPDFEEWLAERPWCAAIVRDFSGEVRFMVSREAETWEDGAEHESVELRVRGDGTAEGEELAFESVQTSA